MFPIDKQLLFPFIVLLKNYQLRLSSPHNNLLRSVFRKLSEVYSIIFMVKGAFLIKISLPFSTVAILESKDTKWLSSLPDTLSLITVSSEITKGLALRLWGAIGVSIKDLAMGAITGPPHN